MHYLIITLHAPLASHGEIAVGSYRASWSRPARSAVLGLVAGALGIDRDAEAEHAALDAGYGYAVRTDASGRPLADYHTAQVPKGARARGQSTRRDELAFGNLKTILSSREYRTDALYTVALWARAGARWSLEELAAALRTPHYVPYFGRKSCPFALPFQPDIIEASDVISALAKRAKLPTAIVEDLHIEFDERPQVACDVDAVGVNYERIEHRRDQYLNRSAWLFTERPEHIVHMGDPS